MNTKVIYGLIGLLFVVIVVGGFFGYQEYDRLRNENQRLSNPEEAARSDIEKTKDQVGKLIQLPEKEEPTVANVVDVSKLQGQEFFVNAENGDKLLVYNQARKAILYRPSIDKIIEVSTIDIGDATEGTELSKEEDPASNNTTTEQGESEETENRPATNTDSSAGLDF